MRSGREYKQASPDSDKKSPRFLGCILFGSSYKRPSLDKRFKRDFDKLIAHIGPL